MGSEQPQPGNLDRYYFPERHQGSTFYNFYFSVQREIMPKTVVQLDYVAPPVTSCSAQRTSTASPALTCLLAFTLPDNLGRTWTGESGRLNQNYGPPQKLAEFSQLQYNSLQASLKTPDEPWSALQRKLHVQPLDR